MLRAVVVEDKAVEREYLKSLLDEVDDVEVIAEAENGSEALDIITRYKPNLVFLDIGLPELDGLEVARQLFFADLKPFIVFVTVDRQHAPEAFDLGSVDYLLKPYNRLRLRKTLSRVRDQVLPQRPANRLVLSKKDECLIIPIEDIIFIETDKRKRVIVHTVSQTYTVRCTLGTIEDKLAGFWNFLRTNRSYLVNLDWVIRIEVWNNHSYRIVFRDYSGEAFLSRNRLMEFRKRLEALSIVSGQ
jgi:DNA-binding LytR/AlgR family response regulator